MDFKAKSQQGSCNQTIHKHFRQRFSAAGLLRGGVRQLFTGGGSACVAGGAAASLLTAYQQHTRLPSSGN